MLVLGQQIKSDLFLGLCTFLYFFLSFVGVPRAPMLRWAAATLHTSSALDAARKGTRAKAEAKKKASKKEEVKREFIPLKKRLEMKLVDI